MANETEASAFCFQHAAFPMHDVIYLLVVASAVNERFNI